MTTTGHLRPCQLASIQVAGRIGEQLDAIIQARYRSPEAISAVREEAVAALEQRRDDHLVAGRGLWQGEFFGKWMLAAIEACRYTEDATLRSAISDAAERVLASQDEDGYIGSYDDSCYGLDDEAISEWNVWGRKYSLWGLIEAGVFLERDECLDAAVRMLDHLMSQVGPAARPLRQSGNFAGLPSASILVPVVRLYQLRGHARHLDYAAWIVDELDQHCLPGMQAKALAGQAVSEWLPHPEVWAKGYEFMSCIEGLIALSDITGFEHLHAVAVAIFDLLREHERNICGGLGHGDKFLGGAYLSQNVSEICDSVHYQRLASALLLRSGAAAYGDELERCFYNQLLGGIAADGGWGLRRRLLAGRHWVAPRHCQTRHQHCCVANLPRSFFDLAAHAVLQTVDGPLIVLYLAGRYQLDDDSVIEIAGDYPASGRIRIRYQAGPEQPGLLRLRLPVWAGLDSLTIDGRDAQVEIVDGYIRLQIDDREQHDIALVFDMQPRCVPLPARAGCAAQPYRAICYGPLVLARDRRCCTDVHGELRLGLPRERHGVMNEGCGPLALQRVEAPSGIWLCYELRQADGSTLQLCDAASAGNTWDIASSDFRIWQPLPSDDPFGI